MLNPAAPDQFFLSKRQRAVLLAALLALGPGLPVLPAQTVDLATIRARAQAGDPEALNALANLHVNGQGVPQDDAEAIRLYTAAAAAGHAAASFNLGMMTEMGRGTVQDPRAAFRHYLKAAEAGFAPAQFNVGNMYANGVGVPQDHFEAVLWFRQAAERGVPEAQYNLGLAYETGRGLSKDEALAQRWYRAAAEQGYARARYNLALMLEEGRGSAMDEAAAVQLYRAAALQGFGPAQNNYGLLLAEGRGGLAGNFKEAYAWLALAAENGVTAVGRDLVAARLQPAELAEAKARQDAIKAQLEGRTAATEVAAAPPATEAAARQLAELGEQLRSAQGEMQRLRTENTRLAGAVQSIQVEKQQLEQRLAQLEAAPRPAAPDPRLAEEKSALETTNRALTERIAGLQDELRQARDTAAQLQAENTRLGRQAAESTASTQLREQLAQLTREMEALRTERAGLTARNEELSGELQGLAATRVRLEEENRRLTGLASSAAAGGDERAQFLAAENARLNDEVKRSTVELANLHRRLRLAEQRAAAAPAAGGAEAAQAAALQGQLEEQRTLAARLTEENRRLQELVSAGDTAAVQTLRQELSTATSELGALRAEKARLEQTLASAPAADARTQAEQERLQRELAEAQGRLRQVQEEVARAVATAEQFQAALARAERDLATATRELQTRDQARGGERDQLVAERNRLQGELAEAQAQMVAARRETEEIRVQLQAAQSEASVQLNRLRTQLTAAQEAVTAAETTGRDRAADLAALTARLDGLQQENAVLRRARAGAEDADIRVKTLERALADAESKLTAATRELKTRADHAGAENAKLSAELDRLQAELGEQQSRHAVQLERLNGQLAEARQALTAAENDGRSRAQNLAELTRRFESLEKEHAALQTDRAGSDAAGNRIRALETELEENRREGRRLAAEVTRLTEQNRQLVATVPAPTDNQGLAAEFAAQLDAAARTLAEREETIAGLQSRIDSLEQDLGVSQQATAAALAAQASAARAMPDVTAMRLEIQALQERARQLELQLAADQTTAAQELAQLAGQLQLSREANRALAEANRALLSSKTAEDAAVSGEVEQLNRRLREQAAGVERLTQERDALRTRLEEIDQAAARQGGNVAELTGLNDRLTREKQALETQLARLREQAESSQNDAAQLRTRLEASERLVELQRAGVTDLTSTNEQLENQVRTLTNQLAGLRAAAGRETELQEANARLAQEKTAWQREREELQTQLGVLRAENGRLAQADQWRAEAESRAASLAGITNQLAAAQRDIAALRAENTRLAESVQAVERDRQARVAALQQENAAISARLRQAQSTLDQIAAAARLINPAAGPAGAVVPPVRTAVPEPATGAAPRTHTVVDGDSLSRISLRYYGTPNRWQEIYDANREELAGANVLRPGQVLRLP